jgi:methionyl-tRNA formyltransferase
MEKAGPRVVFLGSPGFAVPSLERLVLSGCHVVGVVTQPDKPAGRGRALQEPPVREAARRWGLASLQPASLRAPEALAALAAWRPEVMVVAAYGQILSQAVLDLPPYKCINVHASLLPRHRGAAPVTAALLAGDAFTGVSIMLVEKRLDAGPVLAQAAIPVAPADNAGTLTEKLAIVGADLLLEALGGWLRGEIVPRPQDESRATYFAQMKKEAGEIDWTLPAADIWRRVRAFNPWPGAATAWRGRQLKILEAVPLAGEGSGAAGQVLALSGPAVLGIGTGAGVLGLITVQLEGKKAMTAAEFLRGQRDIIGAVLPS